MASHVIPRAITDLRAAVPSVEDDQSAKADTVAAPMGEQADVVAEDDATGFTGFDAYGICRKETSSHETTLEGQVQLRK